MLCGLTILCIWTLDFCLSVWIMDFGFLPLGLDHGSGKVVVNLDSHSLLLSDSVTLTLGQATIYIKQTPVCQTLR